MRNSFGEPQNVVVFGGTSDIGLAIVQALASPSLENVVLAARQPADAARAARRLSLGSATVHTVPFSACNTDSHRSLIEDIVELVGDLDVVVLASGVLGDQEIFDADPESAVQAVTVNYTSAVSVGLLVADRMRAQGHGRLVVLSSVAGERVRAANFVYGSSKAGLDGFAQGLGDALEGSGARVLVVRPGFVRSNMTEGMTPAPFATTPEAVGTAVARALRSGARTIWVPGILRYVFMVLRHLPGPAFRRLPLG